MKLTARTIQNTPCHYITTKQFKTRIITIRFLSDINKETVTAQSLMLSMLKAKNRVYKSRTIQSRYLESLYDTIFAASPSKIGTKRVLAFSMVVVDDNYVQAPLFEKALHFLRDAFMQPDFDEALLREEKQFLKDYFKSEYANKTRYATKQYTKHLMKNHPHGIHSLGDIDAIDAVDLEAIEAAYHHMLTNSSTFISVVGNIDVDTVHQQIASILPLQSVALKPPIIVPYTFEAIENVKETYDVTQHRIFTALKSDVYYRDQDYFDMLVFNALFGEGSDSMLFKTVREAQALAYYVHSTYSPFTGIVTMTSGVDGKNVQKTFEAMDGCLSQIQRNAFSDEDLDLAKTALIQQIKQSYDMPGNLSIKALRSALFSIPFTEDDIIETIAKVKRERVVDIAKKLRVIFRYELGGAA